jgi:hypothetical protein
VKKYHVRFNTKHNGSELVWRIFENDVEHLAKDVRIIGETFTECTTEYGETKWNIACYGRMIWVDKVAIIVTDKD